MSAVTGIPNLETVVQHGSATVMLSNRGGRDHSRPEDPEEDHEHRYRTAERSAAQHVRLPVPPPVALPAPACLGRRIWRRMADRNRLRHDWLHLEEMTDHELKDIGLRRVGPRQFLHISDGEGG